MLLNCGVGEDSWESLGQWGYQTSPSLRKSSWLFIGRTDAEAEAPITLVTWCEELTHWKRPWEWERLKAKGEGDDRGWDGCMASPIWWTWIWACSSNWWWTGKSGVLQSMGSQRVRHDWVTELNWTERLFIYLFIYFPSLLDHVQLFATPSTVACQAPLSMEFYRQEYWSGLPIPIPGDLPDPGIKLSSPAVAGGFFTTAPPGKPPKNCMNELGGHRAPDDCVFESFLTLR